MSKISARIVEVSPEQSGRRLDNFLGSILKNAPKSFIYRIIRRGEVRINGSRARPDTKLAATDKVRVPPMHDEESEERPLSPAKLELIENAVIHEDEEVLIVNKPAGLAVHGGTGLHFGVIDIVRQLRPDVPGMELVHRLDRETSGCLLFAKNYPSLRNLQAQLRDDYSQKTYLCMLCGNLPRGQTRVAEPLLTQQVGGEKRTVVSAEGKTADTSFRLIEDFTVVSFAQATITTGRTHQIRVHADAIGHPVAGDKKYGDQAVNNLLRSRGLKRMFLHATSIRLRLGGNAAPTTIHAPLPKELEKFLELLRCKKSN